MISAEKPVIVVGAGIVGICCAAYLIRQGLPVVMVDRRGPGEQTSFGNAGGLQNMATTPIALPGMLKQIPKWLRDPAGPLHIRPSYLPRAAPWLWAFHKESAVDKVWHNAKALDQLNRHCVEDLTTLVHWAGAESLIQVPGQLYLWAEKGYYDHDELGKALRDATGQEMEVIGSDIIRELEPGLSPIFQIGLRIPGNGHCKNPFRLATTLADKAFAAGVDFQRAEVNGFSFENGEISGLKTDRGTIAAGAVVIAAGMWSKTLVEALGYRVPLESHRGYHVTIRDPGVALNNMCLLIDKKLAITPMEMGIRIAGTVEFAGLDALPDYRRAEVFLEQGRAMLPGLEVSDHSEWMGHRPCTPDSLPVIGRSDRYRNAFFAFGHGHMGLLGSAPTGKTIAELVSGTPPAIDVAPYSIDRF